MSASEGRQARTVVVCKIEDLPAGQSVIVPIGRFGVGIFNVGGKYYGLTNYCPHRGGPLCTGPITGTGVPGDTPYEIAWIREGEVVRCPWHGWEFEIQSGETLASKNRRREYRIRTYPITVRDGMILLEGV